jgi:hypothetical protein
MTIFTGATRPDEADHGGDVYLTDAGIRQWESMLDTLNIAPERWIDRPVLSGMHIQYRPDGSGSADIRLQLAAPPEVIEVLHHQFPPGHIDRVDLDDPIGPS